MTNALHAQLADSKTHRKTHLEIWNTKDLREFLC